jgi:hypothetical protein
MKREFDHWFEIPRGPLLKASDALLQALNGLHFRIGERRSDGRALQIFFEDTLPDPSQLAEIQKVATTIRYLFE